jgi:hypothetical protein
MLDTVSSASLSLLPHPSQSFAFSIAHNTSVLTSLQAVQLDIIKQTAFQTTQSALRFRSCKPACKFCSIRIHEDESGSAASMNETWTLKPACDYRPGAQNAAQSRLATLSQGNDTGTLPALREHKSWKKSTISSDTPLKVFVEGRRGDNLASWVVLIGGTNLEPSWSKIGLSFTMSTVKTSDVEAGLENGRPAKKAKLDLAQHQSIALVLDYGSQYTQLIGRRIREAGVYSMLKPADISMVN